VEDVRTQTEQQNNFSEITAPFLGQDGNGLKTNTWAEIRKADPGKLNHNMDLRVLAIKVNDKIGPHEIIPPITLLTHTVGNDFTTSQSRITSTIIIQFFSPPQPILVAFLPSPTDVPLSQDVWVVAIPNSLKHVSLPRTMRSGNGDPQAESDFITLTPSYQCGVYKKKITLSRFDNGGGSDTGELCYLVSTVKANVKKGEQLPTGACTGLEFGGVSTEIISGGKTLKIEGTIVDIMIVIVVDSRVTHNFISRQMVTSLALLFTRSRVNIKLGDNQKAFINQQYVNLKVWLGDREFILDALILEVEHLYMVVGMAWLKTLGKVTHNGDVAPGSLVSFPKKILLPDPPGVFRGRPPSVQPVSYMSLIENMMSVYWEPVESSEWKVSVFELVVSLAICVTHMTKDLLDQVEQWLIPWEGSRIEGITWKDTAFWGIKIKRGDGHRVPVTGRCVPVTLGDNTWEDVLNIKRQSLKSSLEDKTCLDGGSNDTKLELTKQHLSNTGIVCGYSRRITGVFQECG